MSKNILIFGATGGTGIELVKQSLKRGYNVSVFVRGKADSLVKDIDRITIYKGDSKDYSAVEKAVVGKDAILVALGAIPGKKDNILSISTSNIVKAMQKYSSKRIIVETGAGLVDDRQLLPLMWRITSTFKPMKIMFEDKRAQEKAVKESGLDWVIVRPTNLSNSSLTENYQIGKSIKLKPSSKISRADVADFMVKQIEHDEWLYQAVIVTK